MAAPSPPRLGPLRHWIIMMLQASFPIFRFPFFLLHFGFPFFGFLFFHFPFFRFPFFRFPSIRIPKNTYLYVFVSCK